MTSYNTTAMAAKQEKASLAEKSPGDIGTVKGHSSPHGIIGCGRDS
jgi:hypothetical protein